MTELYCEQCNKEITYCGYGRIPKFCSRKCYYRWYYERNKEKVNSRRLEWYRKHYVPHPIPSKYKNKEEKLKAKQEFRRNYYQQHKDYYKQKNKEWYELHKNDPELKRKQSIAMKKYYKKKVSKTNETI